MSPVVVHFPNNVRHLSDSHAVNARPESPKYSSLVCSRRKIVVHLVCADDPGSNTTAD